MDKIYRTKHIGQNIPDKIYRIKVPAQNILDNIYRTKYTEQNKAERIYLPKYTIEKKYIYIYIYIYIKVSIAFNALHCIVFIVMYCKMLLLLPSAADARGVHASVGDGASSFVGRLATTWLVIPMPAEDGPGGGGRKDVDQ